MGPNPNRRHLLNCTKQIQNWAWKSLEDGKLAGGEEVGEWQGNKHSRKHKLRNHKFQRRFPSKNIKFKTRLWVESAGFGIVEGDKGVGGVEV